MNDSILLEDSLTLQINSLYDHAIITLLENTSWGTQGLIYKMNNLEKEIKELSDPYFASLMLGEQKIAVCVFNKKKIRVNGSINKGFYLCLLAVLEEYQGKGYGKLLVHNATKYMLNMEKNAVIYAYVEEENKRSYQLFKAVGYNIIGHFQTSILSCFRPRNNRHVSILSLEEKSLLLPMLEKQYADHALFDYDMSLTEPYYVYRENDRIVAGVQVKSLSWDLISLPHFPFYKRILAIRSYNFLKIGSVIIDKRYRKQFLALLKAIMSHYNTTICVFYANSESKLQRQISSYMKHGILRFIKAQAVVFATPANIKTETFQAEPLYISNADSI